MKINAVIPYDPFYAYQILEMNVRDEDLWLSDFPEWEEWVKGWQEQGPAYTQVIDGEVVWCGGITLTKWHRGEAWLLLSTAFFKHVKESYKAIKAYLSNVMKEHGLVRVQAMIDPENDRAKRLAEHLGFHEEGLLRSYGPRNEDVLIFARVV